jgi:hypothetical protein
VIYRLNSGEHIIAKRVIQTKNGKSRYKSGDPKTPASAASLEKLAMVAGVKTYSDRSGAFRRIRAIKDEAHERDWKKSSPNLNALIHKIEGSGIAEIPNGKRYRWILAGKEENGTLTSFDRVNIGKSLNGYNACDLVKRGGINIYRTRAQAGKVLEEIITSGAIDPILFSRPWLSNVLSEGVKRLKEVKKPEKEKKPTKKQEAKQTTIDSLITPKDKIDEIKTVEAKELAGANMMSQLAIMAEAGLRPNISNFTGWDASASIEFSACHSANSLHKAVDQVWKEFLRYVSNINKVLERNGAN